MYSPFLLPEDTTQNIEPTKFTQQKVQTLRNPYTANTHQSRPYPNLTSTLTPTAIPSVQPTTQPSYKPSVQPTGSIGDNYERYRQLVFSKESTNNYQAVNKGNYLGGYQLGASALIEAGLVKPNTTNKGLDSPSNWIGGLSKEAYLSNPYIQDQAFKTYTTKNKSYLGSRFSETPNGYGNLMASHLLGAAGSKNLNSVDGNNVRGKDYYNLAYSHFS